MTQTLHVVLVRVEIFIPHAQSLKMKRSVVLRLVERLRSRFNAAIAEFGYLDQWQRCAIGICVLNSDSKRLSQTISQIERFCREQTSLEVTAFELEWL